MSTLNFYQGRTCLKLCASAAGSAEKVFYHLDFADHFFHFGAFAFGAFDDFFIACAGRYEFLEFFSAFQAFEIVHGHMFHLRQDAVQAFISITSISIIFITNIYYTITDGVCQAGVRPRLGKYAGGGPEETGINSRNREIH